jgi:hypothetical protein
MKTQPKTLGGKREGSGRKPLNGVGTINTTVRLTPEQQLHFAGLGGSAWLRSYLDQLIKRNA